MIEFAKKKKKKKEEIRKIVIHQTSKLAFGINSKR